MQGKSYIIHTNGNVVPQHWDRVPDLAFLQYAVGGYIELIPFFTKYNGEKGIAFCNEEGKLHGMIPNLAATQAWRDQGGTEYDYLAGPVLFLTGDDDFMNEL